MATHLPIIVLDLDFTLARFQNGYVWIYDTTASFGISPSIAEIELRKQIDSSDWLRWEWYAESLLPWDSQALAQALERHFMQDFQWYPRTREVLEHWRSLGIKLIVVTAGSIDLQSKKIKLLGFAFDEVYITNPLEGKAEAIAKILQNYPSQQIIYTDDKVSELEKISRELPLDASRLQLLCISHSDRESEKSHSFRKITSLSEIYSSIGIVWIAPFSELSFGKLGFFDSGIGGLTVLKEFKKLYPELDTEYFWDSKNCPYGDRSPDEILWLVIQGVDKLVLLGCTVIILACNTAVTHAVRYLQQEKYPRWSHIKILGVTLPGAEKVVELKLHRVGILATQATVSNRTYRDRVHVLNPHISVQEVAVPWLVNLIEANKSDIVAIEFLLRNAIIQFDKNTEALVLGCTHYPLVAEEIISIWQSIHGTKIQLIDPGLESALRFWEYLKKHSEFRLSRGGTSKITITKHS